MKLFITIILILCSWPAQAGDWSFHLVSVHPGQSGMNNINPGASYRMNDNLRLGALRNSYEKTSIYVMGIAPVAPKWRVGMGLISGYQERYGESVIPAIAVEYDVTDSFSLVWFGLAFNVEVRL